MMTTSPPFRKKSLLPPPHPLTLLSQGYFALIIWSMTQHFRVATSNQAETGVLMTPLSLSPDTLPGHASMPGGTVVFANPLDEGDAFSNARTVTGVIVPPLAAQGSAVTHGVSMGIQAAGGGVGLGRPSAPVQEGEEGAGEGAGGGATWSTGLSSRQMYLENFLEQRLLGCSKVLEASQMSD